MANSNTDLIRDHFVDAVYECYRKGYMTDPEYKLMMDDFTYHFDQIINVVEERVLEPDTFPGNLSWSKVGNGQISGGIN